MSYYKFRFYIQIIQIERRAIKTAKYNKKVSKKLSLTLFLEGQPVIFF